MSFENHHPKFIIKASSWESSTAESKNEFTQLVKSDLKGAQEFCKIYCEKFLLIHEIGHIIQELSNTKDIEKSEAKKRI